MEKASAYRGPDGIHFRIDGNVGVAHLALHTTPEAMRERQPLVGSQGGLVLVADARVDNRSDLISILTAKKFIRDRQPTDADLILATYACWGDECAERIIGDFSFAIWDASRRRLFLARDHLGVRPCYYHASRHSIAFTSEIRQLRQLPGVSDNLNEASGVGPAQQVEFYVITSH